MKADLFSIGCTGFTIAVLFGAVDMLAMPAAVRLTEFLVPVRSGHADSGQVTAGAEATKAIEGMPVEFYMLIEAHRAARTAVSGRMPDGACR